MFLAATRAINETVWGNLEGGLGEGRGMLRPRPRVVAHVTGPLLKVSASAQMGVVLFLSGEEGRQH